MSRFCNLFSSFFSYALDAYYQLWPLRHTKTDKQTRMYTHRNIVNEQEVQVCGIQIRHSIVF